MYGTMVLRPYNFPPETIAAVEMEVGVDPSLSNGKMAIRLDAKDGPVVGNAVVASTGGFETFKILRVPLKPFGGEHRLFLCFEGSCIRVCLLKQLRFVKE